MSLTEVTYTRTADEGSIPRTASRGSIACHGSHSHPSNDADNGKKSFDKGGDIELAQLGATEGVPSSSGADTGKTTPVPLPDLELAYKKKAYAHFLTLCFTLFLAGWNDGTTGPLLLRIQEYYHVRFFALSFILHMQMNVQIGYAVVSLIFVFNCIVSHL